MGQSGGMSRFNQIFEALTNEGWSIMLLELASDCWWAKSIWELRSNWTPLGATVHLSLLVDPVTEIDGNNVPDKSVWAIGVSRDLPRDNQTAERILVPIGGRMNDATSEIVAETAKLRMVR